MKKKFPPSLQNLINSFSNLPTVGPKTASRFVLHLLHSSDEETKNLKKTLEEFNKNIKLCSFCFNPFEKEGKLCPICSDKTRKSENLLVVEKETDLATIEATNKYKGLYFILGGSVSNIKKEEVEKLRIKELKDRIKKPSDYLNREQEVNEVIMGLNPNTEGRATTRYLVQELKSLDVKITQLGRGLPIGGELEYADKETIEEALKGRN